MTDLAGEIFIRGTLAPDGRHIVAARGTFQRDVYAVTDVSNRPVQRRLLAVFAICLAASLPYASTVGNYFVNDDFGVVQLLSQKPLLYFPKWFVTSWMDNIWGATQDEIRPFRLSPTSSRECGERRRLSPIT